MEEALSEVPTMHRFAGIYLICNRDESTILTFRHLLEQCELREQIFCSPGFRLQDSERSSQGERKGHKAGNNHRCNLDRCFQPHLDQGLEAGPIDASNQER